MDAAPSSVALGVGGGIAAYKAAELARALMERGFTVDVVMTRAAEEFIKPLTFAALTGRKVHTSLFATAGSEDTLASAIDHIRIAQDCVLRVDRECDIETFDEPAHLLMISNWNSMLAAP